MVPVAEEPKPTAGFTYTLPDTTSFLTYQFTNSSTNYKELLWQFGDDSTSIQESPLHSYRFPGKYRVVLSTKNSQGYWARKEILLNVVDPNFDATKVGDNYIKTIGGIFAVSRDNGGGPNGHEGSLKVIDEDKNTKFFQSGFAGDLWLQFKLDSPAVAGAYTLTSGNDSHDRDPRAWTFQGSEDSVKWVTLHTVNKMQWTPEERLTRRIYHFDNFVAYKLYRINFKANNGSRDFQLADWTINKKQP